MAVRKQRDNLWNDVRGDAVVEATILFPIIIMVFAGLVLLAMYLPTRAALQQATQYAATAIATERSDTWLRHDPDSMTYYWETERSALGSVYGAVLGALTGNNRDDADNAEQAVINMEANGVLEPAGELSVEYGVVNYIVYRDRGHGHPYHPHAGGSLLCGVSLGDSGDGDLHRRGAKRRRVRAEYGPGPGPDTVPGREVQSHRYAGRRGGAGREIHRIPGDIGARRWESFFTDWPGTARARSRCS